MKKIGILTFQYADNYGAVLQCYALRRVINDFPDCCAEIINYRPPLFAYRRCWNSSYERNLFYKKRNNFEKFLKEKCGIKDQIVTNINDSEYDYYCVGSDQVWNTMWEVEEYFFPNIPDELPKIAYAPSIGLDPYSPYLDKDVLKRYLSRFKSLSVREQEHVELIKKLTGKECCCVLDPTLLLEAIDYEAIIGNIELREEPFILFFWLNHDATLMRGIEFVNTLSRRLDMVVVHSIIEENDYMFYKNGGCMMFEGVENFLWYIKNARVVVTNSYHATLFAIQFRKAFYTFIVNSMKSRINTLIGKLGIENRIVETYLPIEKIEIDMEFASIMEKKQLEKEISMQYLKKALDII